MYICPVCGSSEFAIEEINKVLDAFCRNCGAWQGSLNQNVKIRLASEAAQPR